MNRKVLLAGALIVLPVLAILVANLGRDPHRLDTPLVGRAAPDFVLREAGTGRRIALSELKGQPVVVNFWATWCAPCLAEHPVLQATAAENAARVRFVGVAFADDESKIVSFLGKYGARYPTLVDDGGKTAIAYGVGGVPETFFIDARGTIVAKADVPLDADSMREKLATVLR